MAKKKRYVYRYVSRGNGHNYLGSRKKSKKVIKSFFFLILFVLLLFLIYFGGRKIIVLVYSSDKVVIRDIEVVGTKNVTKAEIKELLPFDTGDNLLKIDLSEAENEIKKLKPELKDIVIKRGWQKVKVKLYERTPEAFIMQGEEILGIDFDDAPFPLRGFMSALKVPKLFYKSRTERKELLNFIKKFKSVSGDYISNISEIKFTSAKDIVFVTRDNTVIFWGDGRTECLSDKFNKFQKICLDAVSKYKQLEYIDMTLYDFGKAVVKPVGTEFTAFE